MATGFNDSELLDLSGDWSFCAWASCWWWVCSPCVWHLADSRGPLSGSREQPNAFRGAGAGARTNFRPERHSAGEQCVPSFALYVTLEDVKDRRSAGGTISLAAQPRARTDSEEAVDRQGEANCSHAKSKIG